MKRLTALLVTASFVLGTVAPVFAQELGSEDSLPVSQSPTPLESEVSTTLSTTTSALPPLVLSTPVETSTPETFIVKFKEDAINLEQSAGQDASEAFAAGEDLSVTEHIEGANISILETSGNEDTESVIERLEDNSLVEYAEPNYTRSFGSINTDDTDRALQWALENTGQSVNGTSGTADADIDGSEAWTLSIGTSTIVAVIDNGVMYTHEDLANQMWDGSSCVSESGAALNNCNHGYDFASSTSPDSTPLPDLLVGTSTYEGYHGTHVAGIIAAQMNNGVGVIGIAPATKIMALKFGLDVASEVKAIDFAIQNGAKIINASYGGSEFSDAEYDAIARFRDAGGIFVAAAGNGGPDSVGDDNDDTNTAQYPASYDLTNIISVAATDQDDALASFSNYGATSVDIGAPGRRILSTATTDGTDTTYTYLSGTSMASPYVAGTVALLMSLYPDASQETMKDAILSSGDMVPALDGKTVSGKRLNAFAALSAISSVDITPPVITLIGSASVSLTVGDTYTEQGATATDDVDGTVSVIIAGNVETSTAGVYTRTYNATDTAGNHAVQVSRTITVSEAVRSGGGGGGGSSKKKKTLTNPVRTLFGAPGTVLGASTYNFSTDLMVGNSGSSVTELQQALTALGFYNGPITGTFGPLTAAGMRAYQAARGLSQTGMLDAATRTSINNVQASTSTSTQALLATLLTLLTQLQAKLAAAKAAGL